MLKKLLLKSTLTMLSLCTAILLMPKAYAADFGLDIGIKIGNTDQKQYEQKGHTHQGPPDHAPAHGYRARHTYHYYPDSEVYYDSGSGVYFYLSDDNWKVSARLPIEFSARLGDHVTIEMESDKPYHEHHVHKSKYPPGKMKHKAKHKNKHKS